MSSSWWGLPGPERFIDWLFEDFSEGRSVIGSLPTTAPTGLRDVVSRRASEEGYCWRDVPPRSSGEVGKTSPIEILCSELTVPSSEESPSIRAWLRAPHSGGLVVWVECRGSEEAAPWLRLTREYSAEAGSAGSDSPRLCILCSGLREGHLPRPEVLLGVRRYAESVSPLDTLLFTSRLLEGSEQRSPVLRLLRSAIAAEVAGTDPALAYHLASASLECLLDPHKVLVDRATELGWVGADEKTGDQEPDRSETWHGQSRLHSSAVVLAGNRQELSRRIWRAQVQVLFPYLEELRVSLVEELRGRIRLPVVSDGREVFDLQDLELAQLRDQARKSRVSKQLQDTLDNAAYVRNRIAHLDVVSEGALRSLGIA